MSTVKAVVCVLLVAFHSCVATVSLSDIPYQFGPDVQAKFIAGFVNGFKGNAQFSAEATSRHSIDTQGYSSSGFVSFSVYWGNKTTADPTCSSTSFTAGFAVNSCVQSSSYSIKFQLSQDSCTGGVVQYFDDKACTRYLGTTSMDGSDGPCILSGDPSYIYLGHNTYQTTHCTINPTPPVSEAGLINVFYDGKTCGGDIVYYSFFPTVKCLPIFPNYQVQLSCDSTGVATYSAYTSADCEGAFFLSSKPTVGMCDTSDNDDRTANDDYVPPVVQPPPSISATPYPTGEPMSKAYIAYCPQQQPTRKPSFMPSFYPTRQEAESISFSAVLTLLGISKSAFDTTDSLAPVLQQALADTMTGVAAEDITRLKVADVTSRRRLQAQPGASVRVEFTVRVTNVYSVEQLFAELSSAVTSGSFNAALWTRATGAGATALQGCTASAVSRPTQSSGEGLSVGAIVGIAIGGVAVLALLLLASVCFIRAKNAHLHSVYVEVKPLEKGYKEESDHVTTVIRA